MLPGIMVPFWLVPLLSDLVPVFGTGAPFATELVPFPGQEHGFYHYGDGTGSESYHATIAATDLFLTKLGFLPA